MDKQYRRADIPAPSLASLRSMERTSPVSRPAQYPPPTYSPEFSALYTLSYGKNAGSPRHSVSDVSGNHIFVFCRQLIPVSRQFDFSGNETVLPSTCASQQPDPGAGPAGHNNHEIVDIGFHGNQRCWSHSRDILPSDDFPLLQLSAGTRA